MCLSWSSFLWGFREGTALQAYNACIHCPVACGTWTHTRWRHLYLHFHSVNILVCLIDSRVTNWVTPMCICTQTHISSGVDFDKKIILINKQFSPTAGGIRVRDCDAIQVSDRCLEVWCWNPPGYYCVELWTTEYRMYENDHTQAHTHVYFNGR